MTAMLLNLIIFVASASVAAAVGNMVWRAITHEATRSHPAE